MIPLIAGTKAAPGPEPITGELLNGFGLTNHAIGRFAERAGLQTSNRRVIEPIVRELLLREGRLDPMEDDSCRR